MEAQKDRALHGMEYDDGVAEQLPGQPAVGTDPTQGTGSAAWQQALRMGMIVNARNRRN